MNKRDNDKLIAEFMGTDLTLDLNLNIILEKIKNIN